MAMTKSHLSVGRAMTFVHHLTLTQIFNMPALVLKVTILYFSDKCLHPNQTMMMLKTWSLYQ